MGPAPAFALRMHSMLLPFVAPAVRQRDKPAAGYWSTSHIQPARQSSDVAPHRVPQRSCVGRRHAEKSRPDVVDGIGAVHVLAPNDLNLIVELFSCERHAKRARRPYQSGAVVSRRQPSALQFRTRTRMCRVSVARASRLCR